MGGDTQNHESLQPINMPGYFSYPIPCSGTLVAVSATGFCILTERTDQQVSLLLAVYRESNGIPMPTYRHITADCEFSKKNSVSGIDYSLGSVTVNDLNIPVIPGEFLSIDFFATCENFSCHFQPAIINNPSKHTLLFLESDDQVDVANLKDFSNFSLLFSATIETSSDKRGKNMNVIILIVGNTYIQEQSENSLRHALAWHVYSTI